MTDLPIQGYASLFWRRDLNDDVVAKGAFAKSLAKSGAGRVRMLHQHDAGGLIGAWPPSARTPSPRRRRRRSSTAPVPASRWGS